MVFRLICLILTLPVSTATTAERVFSAMKYIKNRLRTTMSEDYFGDACLLFVEKDMAARVSDEEIMEKFMNSRSRRRPVQ